MAQPSDPLAHRSDLGEALDLAHQAALGYLAELDDHIVHAGTADAAAARFSGPLPETGIGARPPSRVWPPTGWPPPTGPAAPGCSTS